MADFYPLIARTLAGLAENTPQARAQVYARSREALLRHLRAAEPPLAESEIVRQRLALDEAINRLEREQSLEVEAADIAEAGLRPRVNSRGETASRSTARGRNRVIGLVVVAATIGMAALAWTKRDDPKRFGPVAVSDPPEIEALPADRPKTSARIDGGPAPVTAAAPPPVPAAPPPAAAAPPPASPPVVTAPADPPPPVAVIAQRATLIRATDDPTKPPDVIGGRVTWRRMDSSLGDGKPAEPAISVTFEFEAAEIAGTIIIRRNTDAALPASHTLEIVFTPRPGADPVTEIQLPQFKDEETVRGAPVVGVPFPVGENLFVVALSAVPSDRARNLDLLGEKGWIDLPFMYKSNRRAMITFERGVSGERVLKEVFAAWAQAAKP